MKQLLLDVAALKARSGSATDDPWARARRAAEGSGTADEAQPEQSQNGRAYTHEVSAPVRRTLPLALVGSLGSIGYKDRPMFEDKLATSEFQYDGVKGGTAWKTKVERYMVYKAPVLKEFLEWSEA